MRKSLMLIPLSLMLSINAFSQHTGSLEEYYYLGEERAFTMVPVVHFQTPGNWYFEGRYNYEALNTASAYAGKIFEKTSALSYSVTPIVGFVMGRFKGGSAGVNMKADYKKFGFSSQSQFTFSVEDQKGNFFYSWSELAFTASGFLDIGLALQHTKTINTANRFDKGFFLKLKSNQFSFPVYVFNRGINETYYVVSLNYEWIYKKKQDRKRTGSISNYN